MSQNQFIETEQKIIETEGNVLAFRFLLERFANKQVPDTRFQVVLTAFQTLGELAMSLMPVSYGPGAPFAVLRELGGPGRAATAPPNHASIGARLAVSLTPATCLARPPPQPSCR